MNMNKRHYHLKTVDLKPVKENTVPYYIMLLLICFGACGLSYLANQKLNQLEQKLVEGYKFNEGFCQDASMKINKFRFELGE